MFRINWKLTVFTALLFPFLLSLGFWQLSREQQKIDLQNQYEQRLLEAPISLDRVDWLQRDLGWARVQATGRFDQRRQFYLDNRIYDSQVGYEVLTPFDTDYGVLMVNRGWVPQGRTRQELPSVSAPEGQVTINAVIYVPDGELMMFAEDIYTDSWPQVVQKIDLPRSAEALGQDLLPYSARLEAGSAGLLQPNWQAINTRPGVHRGYAIQWFLMAAVLIVLYIMFSFRRPES